MSPPTKKSHSPKKPHSCPPAPLTEFLSRFPLVCAGMVGVWMRKFHTHRIVFALLQFLTSSRAYQDLSSLISGSLTGNRLLIRPPALSVFFQCVSVFLPLKNLAELCSILATDQGGPAHSLSSFSPPPSPCSRLSPVPEHVSGFLRGTALSAVP